MFSTKNSNGSLNMKRGSLDNKKVEFVIYLFIYHHVSVLVL